MGWKFASGKPREPADSEMRKLLLVLAGIAGLAGLAVPTVSRSQSPPKTCSEAHYECRTKTGLSKECEDERRWCLQTGTFADPRTKAVLMG